MHRRLARTESDTAMLLLYWERERLLRALRRTDPANDRGAFRNLIVSLRQLPHWRWHDRRWWAAVTEE